MNRRTLIIAIAGVFAALAVVLFVYALFAPAPSPGTTVRMPTIQPCPREQRRPDGSCSPSATPATSPKEYALHTSCPGELVDVTLRGTDFITNGGNCGFSLWRIIGMVKVTVMTCELRDAQGVVQREPNGVAKRGGCPIPNDTTKRFDVLQIGVAQEDKVIGTITRIDAIPGGIETRVFINVRSRN